MSNYLEEYVGVQDRLKAFIDQYPDYRIKTHVLEESLVKDCTVYIVKTELYRTEADLHPWTTGLSSESKEKQYALELAETGSLGRALNLAGFFAKPLASNASHRKPAETTNKELGEFLKNQRPNDPQPIVWDVEYLKEELGAEVVEDMPICQHGTMVLKQGQKDGKPYRGWVCSSKNRDFQCPAQWQKQDETGKWVFKH